MLNYGGNIDCDYLLKNGINKRIKSIENINKEVIRYEISSIDCKNKIASAYFYIKKKSIIYKIELQNGKFYIGQTSDFENRIEQHKLRFGSLIKNIEIIKYNSNENDEIYFIEKYRVLNGKNNVINISDGIKVKGPTIERTFIHYIDFRETPTQLAISAMREYLRLKQTGNKVSQGEIASEFGISRVLLSLALKLKQLAGEEIIEVLFNGNKVNISLDKYKPYYTDSIKSIVNFYKKLHQQIAETSNDLKIRKLLTDEDMFQVEEKFNELNSIFNPDQLHYLTNMLIKKGYGKFEEA